EMSSVSLKLRLYGTSSMEGLSGEKIADKRYEPKQKVFVVTDYDGNVALAFTAEEIRKKKSVTVVANNEMFILNWDAASRSPKAQQWQPWEGVERPVIPLYWFAAVRHFPGVRPLAELAPAK